MDQFRMGDKVIVCLPCVGKPFICDGLKGNELKDIQSVVGGYVEQINKNKIHIHPMFLRDDPRWGMAAQLMKGRCNV